MPASIDTNNVDIQLEYLKGQFSMMEKSLEWEVKLQIAELEAGAKMWESTGDVMSSAFMSSADIISSAIDGLTTLTGNFTRDASNEMLFKDIIYREMQLREQNMALLEKRVATETAYMNAKIKMMERGDALIKIDGAGLQPHLEAFMWEILSEIQVRVNEEGHAMLLGLA
jgi:hypothetical protein